MLVTKARPYFHFKYRKILKGFKRYASFERVLNGVDLNAIGSDGLNAFFLYKDPVQVFL